MNKKQVSIYEAKTHLSKLITEAISGVEIIIAKGQKPLVKLIVIDEDEELPAWKVLGKYDKKMIIPEDFDSTLEEWDGYR